MQDPLIRGCVVVRGRRYGVIWGVDGDLVDLLPVLAPRVSLAHDVALSDEQRVAANIGLRGAAIRVARRVIVAAAGEVRVGVLPGAVICLVSQALVRMHATAAVSARWGRDRDHRAEASVPGAADRRSRRVVWMG